MLPSALLVLTLTSVVSAIWPIPQNMTTGSSVLFIHNGVKISYNGQTISYTAGYVPHGPDFDSRGVVQAAVSRVFDRIFTNTFVPWKFVPRDKQTTFEPSLGNGGHSKNNTGGITYMKSLTITQSGTDAPGFFKALSGEVDESYSLTVDASGAATLDAVSAIGIVRGLETFAQLFYAHSTGTFWYTNLAPISITDKPKYSHRGLLMDVARNFFSVNDIKRTIDGLSWNKMNRLHLHATDSQSWPLVLPTLPEVSEKGAYRPGLVYTPEMLKDIQEYAVLRGVQVIVEIDMPSHIGVLGESHPELVVAYNKEPWYWYCAEPPCGAVKLNDSAVEEFMGKMFDDILPRVLPYSSYFHIGGDEMNLNDTLIDPNVASDDPAVIKPLMATFIGNQFQRIRDAGLTPMVWEEMALHWELDLGEDAVVQAWLGPDSVKNITAKGYKVIDSNYQFAYLDCGRGHWLNFDNGKAFTTFYPFDNWCSPLKNWRLIYSHDPADGVEDEDQKKLVLGGEVAAWSESIDGSDFDVTIWPRAAAAAEVYWSGRIDPATGQNRTQLDAAPRLAEMRERMVSAGIGGANVYMSWCTQHDPTACSFDYSYMQG